MRKILGNGWALVLAAALAACGGTEDATGEGAAGSGGTAGEGGAGGTGGDGGTGGVGGEGGSVDVEICGNGADDDGDGDWDCADADCEGDASCTEICDNQSDDDLDGAYDCADSDCAGDAACDEDCTNDVDDNGDGAVDCADAFCAGHESCIEICGNGTDDDGDGSIDCSDADCDADPSCNVLECADLNLGSEFPLAFQGTTVGGGDDYAPMCSWTTGDDVILQWTVPADGNYLIDTEGSAFDTVLAVILEPGDCVGQEIACNDDIAGAVSSKVVVGLNAGQMVRIVVDALSGGSGAFNLNINAAPVDETGLCDNFYDDDNDGLSDCEEEECMADPVCAPQCIDETVSGTLPIEIPGWTWSGGDDSIGSCSEGFLGNDKGYEWTAPADGTYAFLAYSGDMPWLELYLFRGGCGLTDEIACTGSSRGPDDFGNYASIKAELLAGETVIVVADSGSQLSDGDFMLRIQVPAASEAGLCDNMIDDDADGTVDTLDADCAG